VLLFFRVIEGCAGTDSNAPMFHVYFDVFVCPLPNYVSCKCLFVKVLSICYRKIGIHFGNFDLQKIFYFTVAPAAMF